MSQTDSVESLPLICSAKGCRQRARYALLWRNPKLHDESRRKTWLACEEHRTTLGDFLTARGFLRDIETLRDPD